MGVIRPCPPVRDGIGTPRLVLMIKHNSCGFIQSFVFLDRRRGRKQILPAQVIVLNE